MGKALALALALVSGCRGSEHSRVLEVDQPDPSGDHALIWPAPLDSSVAVVAAEPKLQAFSCTRHIAGKRMNGQLQISFVPTTPSDVVFRIGFRGEQPGCNYTGDIKLATGRLEDGFLGKAFVYRCRRSPHTALAVSCGPYLGSDVNVLVRGNGWGRTVSFRVPPSFRDHLPGPDGCDLPFVSLEAGQPTLDSRELVFDLADCRDVS